jgi:hypothetical protein
MKYQNYSNYRLPITTNPLDYGKLIEQSGNKYIIQLPTGNILIIQQYEKENHIRLFRLGELVLEFKDHVIDESSFSRLIRDTKFTFVNGSLVRTVILASNKIITIFEQNNSDTNSIILKTNNPLSLNSKISFSTSAIASKNFGNIIKLRKINPTIV